MWFYTNGRSLKKIKNPHLFNITHSVNWILKVAHVSKVGDFKMTYSVLTVCKAVFLFAQGECLKMSRLRRVSVESVFKVTNYPHT